MGRPKDSGRIDLREVFLQVQHEMLAHLAVGGIFEHASTAGAATEQRWIQLLNSYLPQRYRAASAFIVDARGARSRQIDIAVYDNFYSPLLFPPHSSGLTSPPKASTPSSKSSKPSASTSANLRRNADFSDPPPQPLCEAPEPGILTTYIRQRYDSILSGGVEFDWDEANLKHLQRHRVSPAEFEQVIANDPLDLDYEVANGEERYKPLGVTARGRLLMIVWTVRAGKIRAITPYPASRASRKLYMDSER